MMGMIMMIIMMALWRSASTLWQQGASAALRNATMSAPNRQPQGHQSKLKKLLVAAAIAAAFVLPAQAATKKPVAAQPQKVNTKAAVAKAKNAIAWQLKDPESVRWRRAKVASNGNVCIEVNAKNSYGGYTGFQVYLFNSRTGSLVDSVNDYAGMYCKMSRVMPDAVYVSGQ